MPTWHAPPSNTGTEFPRPLATCCAVVGLSCVYLLADGAAKPRPVCCNTCCAIWCAGTRKATVGSPARRILETDSFAGNTMVNGPGQKAAANFCANGGKTVAQSNTCSLLAKWTINGLFVGRCLMAKICFSAHSLRASAASP